MHYELAFSILGAAAVIVWRLATYAGRLSVLEYEVKRLRAWRHKQASNLTQLMLGMKQVRHDLDELDFEEELPSKVTEVNKIK